MKITFKINDFNFQNFCEILKKGDERHLDSGVDGHSWGTYTKDEDSTWDLVQILEDGTIWWNDTNFNGGCMKASIKSDRIVINTFLSDYTYTVQKNGVIEYEGAYMGLLSQNILPELLLKHRFTGFEPVEATSYSGTLKDYWDLRNKKGINPKRYKGWQHPYCLKERPTQVMRWHEALDANG